MGRIGRFLEFLRGDKFDNVQVDEGGGVNRTAHVFAGIGDDSQPLSTDYAIVIDIPGAGRKAVVGWIDPENTNTSDPGARRMYSRSPDTGAIVAEIILGNDGTVTVKNDDGSIALGANGTVNINGVKIDTSGNINSPATITATTDCVGGGVSLKDHTHEGSPTAPDGVQSDTGSPIAPEAS